MTVVTAAPFGLRLLLPLLVTLPLFASANVVYLRRYAGDPVDFFCESHDRAELPIGFYLKLKSPHPEKELMFLLPPSPETHSPELEGRLRVQANVEQHRLNVTVLSLRKNDSGFYACEFMYSGSPQDRSVVGSPSYFLFVEGNEVACSCGHYVFLLYAISAITGVFLVIIFALGAAACCKVCRHERPQNPLPIYEEMTGLKPKKEKGPQEELHLEEHVGGDKPHCRLSQENYYVSPTRVTRATMDNAPQLVG